MYTYLSIYLYLEHLRLHLTFDEHLVEKVKEVMDDIWHKNLSEKDKKYLDSRPLPTYKPVVEQKRKPLKSFFRKVLVGLFVVVFITSIVYLLWR